MNNDSLNKKNYYNALYDHYHLLLTQKQQRLFESYYAEDYSLSEIADDMDISRNAVWDSLKKVEVHLDHYEKQLHLHRNSIQLELYISELEEHTDLEGKQIIQKIREME